MTKPIILLFGAGAGVGLSTARTFLSQGYRVASTSRSANQSDALADSETHMLLSVDVRETAAIEQAFETVRSTWGHPNVIVYNAYGSHPSANNDPFPGISTQDFTADLHANTIGLFAALKLAVQGFKALPAALPKRFFYTGNCLNNYNPVPGLMTLGVGKSASSYLIADADAAYKDKGWRFFFVDERTEEGQPMYKGVNGPAHAEFFWSCVNGEAKSPWWATFVRGKGYVAFPTGWQ